jgi:SAM-dependent methyltransferase
MLNPHFDQGRVVWRDEYSGQYGPPDMGYSEQFDLQWKTALEGNEEYFATPGASTADDHIDDRVYEWTGKHPRGSGFRHSGDGVRVLDHVIDPSLIRGKRCIDIGCGMGRWTRTMQRLGAAEVVSLDMSAAGLASTGKFNEKTMRADIMRIPEEHPELVGQFDFANFWGVAMCTHDPRKAFDSAASTVKKGGALYLMVYATEGMHGLPITTVQRRAFHKLKTVPERLAYVDHIHRREWDRDFPLAENVKNKLRNVRRLPRGSKVGILDLLEPFYNWVIPLDVIHHWMSNAGFSNVRLLNEFDPQKCAYHVLGRKV